jgi:hypothetical protein
MIEQAFNPLGATGLSDQDQLTGAFAELVTRAAQWGADQELEACCALMELSDIHARDFLQSARRSKPPSLKELALYALHGADDQGLTHEHVVTIRRALEQLPDND